MTIDTFASMPEPDDFNDGTFVFKPTFDSSDSVKLDKVHYLVVIRGNDMGKRIEVGDTAITFGRTNQATHVLDDQRISKLHCKINLLGGELIITDMGSTNGTYLDGERVQGSRVFPQESVVQLGQHKLKHEFRRREDAESSDHLNAELQKARDYVFSLLPKPLENQHLMVDWTFAPSDMLGGDAFGYHLIDPDHYAFYLLDVCGHGVGAAMHSSSALNVVRSMSLPKVDFHSPAQVLTELNKIFQMEDHGNMYFTMWYGVFCISKKTLKYASAGHPPSLLFKATGGNIALLKTKGLAIGAIPKLTYPEVETNIQSGDQLFIFSDGAYEIRTPDGGEWGLPDFQEVLRNSAGEPKEKSSRVKAAVEHIAGTSRFEDDFSLICVQFL
jgi:serine phosphatase RsbU (regulator of sigma subunit)